MIIFLLDTPTTIIVVIESAFYVLLMFKLINPCNSVGIIDIKD